MAVSNIIDVLDNMIVEKIAHEIDDRELLSRSEIEDMIKNDIDYLLEDMVIDVIKNRLSFDVSVTE